MVISKNYQQSSKDSFSIIVAAKQSSIIFWILAILCQSRIEVASKGADKQHLENLNKWWDQVSKSYPKYDDTAQLLNEMKKAHPDLVNIYSVGKTWKEREMWVINLRANIQQPRKLLQPPMKIVANMHGDETVGRALVLMLAVDMVKRFLEKDPRVVQILSSTDVHLMPTVNPDGFEIATMERCETTIENFGRYNAHHADLNRNFPDQFKPDSNEREPETRNMMKFITTNDFVLSANLHAGSLVAAYPFDSVPLSVETDPSYPHSESGVPSFSPDDDVFIHLATLYARTHKTMTDPKFQCGNKNFTTGVTNGAEWYNVRGGMQDFNYVHSNCFEITIELSCCKYPKPDALLHEWEINQEALYKFVEATHMGIRGLVKDSAGNPVGGAEVVIAGINHRIRTTKQGEFWRLLVPGKYNVRVLDERYDEPTGWVNVEVDSTVNLKNPTILNFTLADADLDDDDDLSGGARTNSQIGVDNITEDSTTDNLTTNDSTAEDSTKENSAPKKSTKHDSVTKDSSEENSTPKKSTKHDSVTKDSTKENSTPKKSTTKDSIVEDSKKREENSEMDISEQSPAKTHKPRLSLKKTKTPAANAQVAAALKGFNPEFRHYSREGLDAFLARMTKEYPQITRLYSLGRNAAGQKINVLEITKKSAKNNREKTDLTYVGNVHPNDKVGREKLILITEYLLTNYGRKEEITRLIDNTRIHIFPNGNSNEDYGKAQDYSGWENALVDVNGRRIEDDYDDESDDEEYDEY